MIAPRVLDGVRIVALASNIPGPLAAARCTQMGASVTKIEPRRGDALELPAPHWYEELTRGQRVLRLDLHESDARAQLDALVADADVLVSAMRSSALERLGLDWNALHARFPRVCHVAIFGALPPHDDRAGHDLTYQAQAGLTTPPSMPRSLIGDLAAAERAVAAVFALLYHRERMGEATRADVGIVDCAQDFALPLHYELTTRSGALGGALPTYRFYRASDGWIALAALEAHFAQRLPALIESDDLSEARLAAAFAAKPAAHWEREANALDIPLVEVRQ